MSTQREPSVLRYPLAVLACAATICLCVPVLIGAGWFIFTYLDGWVDRQVLVLRFVLQCALGLVLLGILAGGWEATKWTWNRVVHPPGAADGEGRKYGAHARWRPGYDPNADRPAGDGEHGRCPKCGFTHRWDGNSCGHCGFAAD